MEPGQEFTIGCGLKFDAKGANTNIRQPVLWIRKVSKQGFPIKIQGSTNTRKMKAELF